MSQQTRRRLVILVIALFLSNGLSLVFAEPGNLSLTILNPDPQQDDRFGYAVAATPSGDLLIGAVADDTGAPYAGIAYLVSGTTGELLLTLNNPTPEVNDRFGISVAATLDGHLLVGAIGDDAAGLDSGSVYLFDGTTGFLLRTFTNPTPEAGDLFGHSIAATTDGNVFVGAHGDDTVTNQAGSAYLFEGDTGNLLLSIHNPVTHYDNFGWSVATTPDGDLFVGAPLADPGATFAGATYLFDGSTGALLLTVNNPDPERYEQFGYRVATTPNGDLIVGVPFENTHAVESGAVYLFDGTSGAVLLTINNPFPGYTDHFGISVAATPCGDLIVGASFDDVGASDAGAAYLFDGTTGMLNAPLHNPAPSEGDNFGNSVAPMPDGRLAVGAYHDDTRTGSYGKVYVFDGMPVASLNANFTLDHSTGLAPLTVQFTDTSTSTQATISSWLWDFDNDGAIDATDQHPAHTFTEPGTYTVSLTVADGQSTDMEIKAAAVIVTGNSGVITWPLDEISGCTAFDLSGIYPGTLGADCTGGNSPIWEPGQLNGGLDFDGVDDMVTIAPASALAPEQLTVAAWVKPDALGGWDTVLMYTSSNSWTDGYGLGVKANEGIAFWVNHFNNLVSAPVPLGLWSHVAATYNGSEMNLYIDGELMGTRAYSEPINYPSPTTTPLQIGKGVGNPTLYGWDGELDHVQLLDRAADDVQIREMYETTRGEPVLNEVRWAFEEGSGCVADSGALGPSCGSGNGPIWALGRVGGALDLDGVDDLVEVTAAPELAPEQITVAAWIMPEVLGSWDTVLMHSSSNRWGDGYGLFYRSGQGITFYVNGYTNMVAANVTLNRWTHVAATYDLVEMKLYIDGVLVASKPYTEPIRYPSSETTPLSIGKGVGRATAYGWNGSIDEVRLRDHAATAADIWDMFQEQ